MTQPVEVMFQAGASRQSVLKSMRINRDRPRRATDRVACCGPPQCSWRSATCASPRGSWSGSSHSTPTA